MQQATATPKEAPASRRPMPSGWFRIATSGQVRPGGQQPCEIHGSEVVASRDHRGEVSVFWPSASTERDRIRPSVEQLGCIFVFMGTAHSAPPWQLPLYDTRGWTKPLTRVLWLDGHVQDVAENAVDYGHFSSVHGYSNLQQPVLEISGPTLRSKFGFTRAHPLWPAATVDSVFDTDVHGLGLSVTDLRVPSLGVHFRVILTATQIDDARMTFGVGVSSECPPPFAPRRLRRIYRPWLVATWLQMKLIHPFVIRDIRQDEEIWRHRTMLESPALAAGDGPIIKFRRWSEQFYA